MVGGKLHPGGVEAPCGALNRLNGCYCDTENNNFRKNLNTCVKQGGPTVNLAVNQIISFFLGHLFFWGGD